MNTQLRWQILAVGAGALMLLTACSEPQESTPSSGEAAAYNTELSVVDIMNLVLEPAADILWDSGGWVMDASGYEELYPTTDDGWAYVLAQAAVVVEAGNMLALSRPDAGQRRLDDLFTGPERGRAHGHGRRGGTERGRLLPGWGPVVQRVYRLSPGLQPGNQQSLYRIIGYETGTHQISRLQPGPAVRLRHADDHCCFWSHHRRV
ncbi:MAG: hypothetical protein RL120_19340 [Gammaproteobacteria bacterium]